METPEDLKAVREIRLHTHGGELNKSSRPPTLFNRKAQACLTTVTVYGSDEKCLDPRDGKKTVAEPTPTKDCHEQHPLPEKDCTNKGPIFWADDTVLTNRLYNGHDGGFVRLVYMYRLLP